MERNKIIYALTRKNSVEIYVGITNDPERRLLQHRYRFIRGSAGEQLSIVLLDEHASTALESNWISHLFQLGFPLLNKRINKRLDNAGDLPDRRTIQAMLRNPIKTIWEAADRLDGWYDGIIQERHIEFAYEQCVENPVDDFCSGLCNSCRKSRK